MGGSNVNDSTHKTFLSPKMLDDTGELRAAWMEVVESLAKEYARVRDACRSVHG